MEAFLRKRGQGTKHDLQYKPSNLIQACLFIMSLRAILSQFKITKNTSEAAG